MPGCDQRNSQIVSQNRPQNAAVAGPGYVHEVRAELLQCVADPVPIPQEQRIELHIHVDWKREPAAPVFDGDLRSAALDAGRRAGVNAEEGKAAPVRELLQFAAGQRDAVDLVKAVGEQRHAGRVLDHNAASLSASAQRRAGRIAWPASRFIRPTAPLTAPGCRRPHNSETLATVPSGLS